jgi:rhodanese-related sulfurtransferase
MPSSTEITTTQLARLVGTPDAPVLLDVRIDEDFAEDPFLLPAAIRVPFDRIEMALPLLNDGRAVIYCQKGFKISQGAAALLRLEGVEAETLQGGQFAWRDAKLPVVRADAVPFGEDGTTLWVTRQRPKIDRIASPWLIRRFVDPRARFIFVAADQVMNVAERFGATAFDVEDAPFGHDGERCTFDAMLSAFGLDHAPLSHMARIIRAADTGRPGDEPQAEGLLALSFGLSRMHRDDNEQLEAGLALYDALYRWARDATGEQHDH